MNAENTQEAETNAEGVRQFQPRVGFGTLGKMRLIDRRRNPEGVAWRSLIAEPSQLLQSCD